LLLAISQGAAQQHDELVEVVLFDDGARPQRLGELGPRHGRSGALNEVDERIKGLGGKTDRSVVPPREQALSWIEAETPERVGDLR
jgi:hypothetical protein